MGRLPVVIPILQKCESVVITMKIKEADKRKTVDARAHADAVRAEYRERMRFLKKLPLFEQLTAEQLEMVASIMRLISVEPGTYLCRQGDVGKELYIINSGRVEVVHEDDAESNVIYTAGEEECIGEMAILADIPRTASLRTRGIAELYVIDGKHFMALLHRNPELAISMIRLLVRRLTN